MDNEKQRQKHTFLPASPPPFFPGSTSLLHSWLFQLLTTPTAPVSVEWELRSVRKSSSLPLLSPHSCPIPCCPQAAAHLFWCSPTNRLQGHLLPFSSTHLAVCSAMWNSTYVEHTHPSLVLLKLSCSILKKFLKYVLKYGFLNTLSPRSLHLGCGAPTTRQPEMGCLEPVGTSYVQHGAALTTLHRGSLKPLLLALGHLNSIH